MRVRNSAFRLGLLFFCFSFSDSFATPRKMKAVYCTQSQDGSWELQRFRPLINPARRSVFSQMSFAGPVLETVRLRRFQPGYEVVFEYRFDRAGKLNGLVGSVEVWDRQWIAEADLYPDSDGRPGPMHLKYYKSRERDQIARPEDSEDYTVELSRVPLYRTIESLPCGGSLREAEKMNATQE